ncbi:unnamed protein product, partial [marine sediment metagenome]
MVKIHLQNNILINGLTKTAIINEIINIIKNVCRATPWSKIICFLY